MIPLHDDIPGQRTPFITYALIGLCVLTFFWQLASPGMQATAYQFGVTPALLFGQGELPPGVQVIPYWLTPVTSMFLHGGWMHLLGNMLYLWIFGNNVEDAMGHGRYLLFYLLCGLAAVFGNALPDPGSTIPMIGASGAIAGVLGAYLLLYPHARILVAIPLGFILHTARLRAVWVLGFWFVLQVFYSVLNTGSEGGGGVAWLAHVGGFLAGMLLVGLFKKPNVPLRAFSSRR